MKKACDEFEPVTGFGETPEIEGVTARAVEATRQTVMPKNNDFMTSALCFMALGILTRAR